jgi:glycosyltransferase involved in cell wall biosynthesis
VCRSLKGTVAVISHNEGMLLDACLSRVEWADEIIVMDIGSTDNTQLVARRFGAKIISVPWVPISERVRQIGLDASRNEWVLHLDPDELVPLEMETLWQSVVSTQAECAAVRWPFEDVSFGSLTPRLTGGAAKLVLFSKSRVHFSSHMNAHEEPLLHGAIYDAVDVPSIEHHSFRSTDQAIEKLMRYARSGAAFESSFEESPFLLPRLWFRHVVRSEAWRDGSPGIRVGTLLAIHDFVGICVRAETASAVMKEPSTAAVATLSAASRVARLAVVVKSLKRRALEKAGVSR